MRFDDKVVVVTGSSKGIGNGIAGAFSREGANVVITSRNEEEGTLAAKAFGSDEGRAVYIKLDVRDLASIKQMIETSVTTFGKIDVLVNNAGKSDPYLLEDTTPEEWDFMVETDLRSQFFCCQYALPYLKETKGNIINLSSVGALLGFANQAAYNAVKLGNIGLTKSLATDLAPHGIRVNAIAPGLTDTPDTKAWLESKGGAEVVLAPIVATIPLGRMGTPEDMGKAAVYLADADYVTGSTLVVDGGWTKY